MKKTLINILFILLIKIGHSQTAPKVFIYEFESNNKDSIIKMGKLNINNCGYEIKGFTYVLIGYSCENEEPRYEKIESHFFSNKMIEDLKAVKTKGRGTLIIQDIIVKRANSDEPCRKLEQQIKIILK